MKIAKDKARELIDMFLDINKFVNPNWRKENAKQCALICVDEIIDVLQNIPDIYCKGNIILDAIQYWEEVKQEIK